ncbi:MAG: hypothetical protein ACXV3V_11065 [Actinomycetes bacterium]
MTRSLGLVVFSPVLGLLGLLALQLNDVAGIALLAVAGMAMQAGLIGYAVEGAVAQYADD